MKWNSPPVLLTAAAVAAVGIMALAGRSRAAYTENDCSRIVIKSEQALADELQRIIADPKASQEIVDLISAGASTDELSDAMTNMIIDRLAPGCPSPLPDETVLLFEGRPDEPMTLGEIRERMREDFAAASAAGRHHTPPPAAMAGAFRR